MENINKVVRDRCNALINSEHDFKTIYQVMFSNESKILGEYSKGYQIVKSSYGEENKIIGDIAYSLNVIYTDLKDQYIGICMDSCLEWVEAFWAILRSGNKPYLVNLRHPKEFANKLLKSINVKYVIGLKDLGYEAEFIDIKSLNKTAPEDYEFSFANEIVLSTSATTMNEKLVFYTGKEISAQILNCKSVLKENKIVKRHYKGSLKQLVFLPLYHIFGLMATYLWFAFFGRTLVFLQDYSSDTILETIRKHKVTHIFAVPLLWSTIEKEINKKVAEKGEKTVKKFNKGIALSIKLQRVFPLLGIKIAKHLLKEVNASLFGDSVMFCISGGAYIKNSTLRLINGLGYPLYNGYGMSEIGITSVELSPRIDERLKNSIGKPFPSVDYKIDENGTLLCKGKSLSHKVLVNNTLTTLDDESWFTTNDIVHVDDNGKYYIDGRRDDLFIGANGENINPDIIEQYFNFERVNNFSIINYQEKLTLILEIPNYLSKDKVDSIINHLNEINDTLPTPYKITSYYFTYDKIVADGAIKVSRQYLLNKLNSKSIHLISYTEIKNKKEDEVDEEILNEVMSLIASSLSKDLNDITKDGHYFFDLGGTSIEYFSLVSKLNEAFDSKIEFNDDFNCYNAVDITKYIERKL